MKKRNLTQQKICDEAIQMLENGFLKDSSTKRRKIQESKEEKKDYAMNEPIPSNYFYDFKVLQIKGSGAFGRIIEAQKNGMKYAIKQIKNHGNKQSEVALKNEKDILRRLDHQNIVKYYQEENNYSEDFIVIEYVENDLGNILRDGNIDISSSQRKSIMKSLLDAVDYLHNMQILHRDLKPSNILCDRNLSTIKVCDFGLSTVMIKNEEDKIIPMNPYVVTLWYRAPELLLNHQNYDGCIDIWSLGLIAVELSQPHPRKPIFYKSTNEKEMLESIIKLMGVPSKSEQYPNNLPGYLRNFAEEMESDFICQMLNLSMIKRVNSAQALQHEWLNISSNELQKSDC